MTLHYIISDLHLGMGRMDDGSWHPLEDFESDHLFRKFLDLLAEEKADELIINGDWIDFHQLEPFAYPSESLYTLEGHRLGWTEADSLKKLESCRAARAHKGFFDDLRHFLRTNQTQLTVLMGNHDPDIFWPAMQEELRQLLTPPRHEQLLFNQTYVRRGTAHIEHGNQYCSPENRFANPQNIFHFCPMDSETRLEMVWGTIFMMEFFNNIEAALPFADNIKTQSRALWLGIMNGWVDGATAAKFVKFLWGAGIPWGMIAAKVLSGTPLHPEELIKGVADPGIYKGLIGLYNNVQSFREEFDREIARTSEQEWKGINRLNNKPLLSLEELLLSVEGESSTLGIFRNNPELRGAKDLLKIEGVEQVVFGHTHTEIDGTSPNAKVKNYFNTGSWVKSLDLSKRENRIRLQNITADDLTSDKWFELRLSTVLIEVEGHNQTKVSLQRLELPAS